MYVKKQQSNTIQYNVRLHGLNFPHFWGQYPKKSLRSVLLPTDERHVLKFRRDPFRGVDVSDSKKATFMNVSI